VVRAKRSKSSTSDRVETAEERMERDAREVAELSARLREKDEKKTRKVIETPISKALEAEAEKRRSLAESGKDVIEELRKISRHKYVEQRAPKQLRELEDRIKDDQYLFDGVKLTDEELKRQEIDQRVLNLAREHQAVLAARVEGYQMPDDYFTAEGKLDKQKKMNLLEARYQEVDEKPHTDHDEWEEAQVCFKIINLLSIFESELIY
jgi:pre-mRNA-splicing factor ATP-dependent RNA helicase DHX16